MSRIRGKILALSLSVCAALSASSCSRALFFPSPNFQITPSEIGLSYDDVEFASSDGTPLHGWWLRAGGIEQGAPATVLFFHGNAGNVSTHLGSVLWLPAQGFQVFLFDYRGFGRSGGDPDIAAAHRDAVAALRLVATRPDVDRGRIVAIGQSLGGAIALSCIAALADEIPVRALVVDSAPSDFRGIAREKLAGFWLTWPFQIPLSWTIPAQPRPVDAAANLANGETTRLLIVHGDRDAVVPVRHGIAIAGAAPGAELLIVPDADHIQAFEQVWVRHRVAAFLRSSLPRLSGGLEAHHDEKVSPSNRLPLATRNPGIRWTSPRLRRSHVDIAASRRARRARRDLR